MLWTESYTSRTAPTAAPRHASIQHRVSYMDLCVKNRSTCMFLQKRGTARARCHVNSKWRILLNLVDKTGRESRMATQLYVCNKHRCQLTAKEILDDVTWRNVQHQMATKGYLRLRRSRTKLAYTPREALVVEKV